MTTPTREDYIRAIARLEREEPGAIKSVTLAAYLGLAKSTVSERVRALIREGFVQSEPYGRIAITKKGKALAKQLTYKHRVIEVFLHETLGFPKSRVHEQAHELEHAFTDEAIRRLAKHLGHPSTDPHGKKILR